MTAVCALTIASAAEEPVAGQNREERAHMQMAAELRILQEQQQQLALAVAGLSQSLTQSLTESTKALTSRIDSMQNMLTTALANQGAALSTIGTDVRGIDQRSQEAITRLLTLKEEIDQLRKAMQQLLARPVYAPPALNPVDPAAPLPDVSQLPVAQPPSPLGLSASRLFATGQADYAGGNYTSAIETFQRLLKDYSTSEFADDARFYIGESEFLQNRFEEAIGAYNLVIQDYPKGDVIPDVYYKLGLAHERLGRMDSARVAWQRVVKEFSNSNAAGLARQRLSGLDKVQGAKP